MLFSQEEPQDFIISEIRIEGNKRTKDYVILRELEFQKGDTITFKEEEELWIENEKRILSTSLFNHVNITREEGSSLINIQLQENWFIYPNFIFELADRNFNVWWNEQGKALDRVNIGGRINWLNVSGHRDRLKLTAQLGYTRRLDLEYGFPYVNKAKTLGISGAVVYTENDEIGYETIGNKTVFYSGVDDRIVLRRFRVASWVNYRPKLYGNHFIKLEFHRNSIDDFVAEELNPDYFLNGISTLRFFKLEYDFSFDKRRFSFYPEGGYSYGISVQKEGLGIFNEYNNLLVEVRGEHYTNIKDKIIVANLVKLKTNLVRDQIGFANNTGLGYNGNLVSGYELFVVDGTDFALTKSSVRWKMVDELLNLDGLMPLRQFKKMNIKAYLSFNMDTGYVNEPTYKKTNFLNNRMLLGYGPGLDIMLFNTHLFSFEYSFNHLGQSALFFSNSVSF
jgi:outer membrane protein assembly factor BamA